MINIGTEYKTIKTTTLRHARTRQKICSLLHIGLNCGKVGFKVLSVVEMRLT